MRLNELYFLLLLAIFSCKKSENNNSGNSNNNNNNQETPQLFKYDITPSTTNSAISSFNNVHEVVLDTRTTLRNKLFVFLPGTGGFPSAYQLIVNKAAFMGYHAIGLMYPNSQAIYTAAGSSNNLNDFGSCRQEIFDGIDHATGVSVDVNNSIHSRLIKLLQYLHQQHPTQNWNQFLSVNEVEWSKVVVAGHSQGGGHAFYISKIKSVDRAISFASIDWNSNFNQSASWISMTGATPVSKLYSINGLRDQIFAYANVQTQLNQLGLQGPATSIDGNNPPYANSHMLTTNATPALPEPFTNHHNLTCLDAYVPKDLFGNPAPDFDKAWGYFLGN
jgi:hypothetical protein